jgi:CHAT domain-containing protein
MGRLEEAVEIGEQVLSVFRGKFPEDHPGVLKAAEGLAMTRRRLGKPRDAATLLEAVLASRQRLLPADHPDLLLTRELLIWSRVEAGDSEAAAKMLAEQRKGILERHVQALYSSPREACAVVGTETQRVDQVLYRAEGKSEDSGAELFALLETRRHAATAPAAGSVAPELEELWREASKARSELNDLVLGGGSAAELPAWRERMGKLSLERDKALAAVRRKLAEGGHVVEAIRSEALAGRLPEGALAVGFHRYGRWEKDPGSSRMRDAGPALLAMVLAPGGKVHRVELGPTAELEELVRRWRTESTGGRGLGSASAASAPADVLEAGRMLRARILDPVLAAAGLEPRAPAAGGARGPEVYVVLDDFLHLVPLDALPLDEEGLVVGDRWRIRNEVSFARLLETRKPAAGKGLLAVGGVDYETAAEREDAEKALVVASAPLRSGDRSGSLAAWKELPGTRQEVAAIASLFEGTFGEKASLLERGAATKAAFAEGARGKRFVHVATHGWFAQETILSSLDARKSGDPGFQSSAGRTAIGLAPMTLCGLCLSGANKGRDELGRVPGLLTAEELAGFDLSACELAVLSACETNVGLSRAGQGILSLQSALHSAGARTTITSLWRVHDELTRELMERFYRHLWTDKATRSEALWQAKKEMRQQGHPPSAWAGWVLSGEP